MVKTQTVLQLLNQFKLNLELPINVLNLEIEGEYNSYKIITRILGFINSKGYLDYGHFDCYHFENEDRYCEIVPACNYQMVLSFEKVNGRWEGYSWDSLGNVSVRS